MTKKRKKERTMTMKNKKKIMTMEIINDLTWYSCGYATNLAFLQMNLYQQFDRKKFNGIFKKIY